MIMDFIIMDYIMDYLGYKYIKNVYWGYVVHIWLSILMTQFYII